MDTTIEQPGDGTARRILLVEDDRELGPLLLRLFRGAGYAADLAADGQAGLHLGLTRRYGVLVIDRGLPAIEGLDLLARLRRRGVGTPALLLTALGTVGDRVAGLDGGAEDYMVKPFEVDELLARVRALMRRPAGARTALPLGAAEFDLVSREVHGDDGAVTRLSGREADLLRMLAETPDRVFTRAEIVRRVFPDAAAEALVDTYVHYLRRKLGAGAVHTVRGAGYRLGAL
ncbi:response regulator transcription factor [Paractinoplanes atraurantiacus]|uniref:DNA-binding response regulator, OmpR family, contains REC and winged-helix (WHTH) domain n=1 Tax=Paractinoplanes atraurantiacus TaxID=1036182 RepID=A0A285JGP0_9ACTN|nr:response regulator transcription factor [Actinoplanes atraurantiacus]SNY59442.1 DNA-binding response regulator, OmpR family, contains REC and winged-helix (wHTH) domain [Actinoplanes atraurantiacus]